MGSAAGTAARQVAVRAVAAAKGRPVASLATSTAFRTSSLSSSSSSSSRLAQAGTDLLRAEDLLQGLRRTAPPPGPNAALLEPTWLRHNLRQTGMQGRIAL